MLVIPLDRITLLLNRASEVEIEGDDEVVADGAETDESEAVGETDAYRALSSALDSLTEEEISELLALAAFGEQEDSEASWELVKQEVRSMDEKDALNELLRALVYTDAIETALGRLGLGLPKIEGEEEAEPGEEMAQESEEAQEDATPLG